MKVSLTNVFICLILVWLIALTISYIKQLPNEKWKCSLVNCTDSITGEEWAKDNCFMANNQEVCKVSIDGINQLVAKQGLNLSAIQQCIKYTCIEETKIRAANYIFNITS